MEWINYDMELVCASSAKKEWGDCTVMAWCNTFDCSYEKAYKWLARFGRKHRKGMKIGQIKDALSACKIAKVRFGSYDRKNTICLSKFCKKHPVGRYYVLVSGHALCVKDGVVYDWKEGSRRQVRFACRVYLSGEI